METLLMTIHFLSLAVGIGGGVATAIAGAQSANEEPSSAMALAKLQSRVGNVGYVALILLWVTGIWMVFAKYGGFGELTASFNLKMLGVLGLTGALTGIQITKRRAIAAGKAPDPARMKMMGQIALLSAVFTVIMAVVTFG